MEDSAEDFRDAFGGSACIPHHAEACHHFEAFSCPGSSMRQLLCHHPIHSQRLQILHLPDESDPLHTDNLSDPRLLQVSMHSECS